jgi:hypothetical protein
MIDSIRGNMKRDINPETRRSSKTDELRLSVKTNKSAYA